jgi:hypothetical protein
MLASSFRCCHCHKPILSDTRTFRTSANRPPGNISKGFIACRGKQSVLRHWSITSCAAGYYAVVSSSKSSTSNANSTAQRGEQKRAVVIMPGLGNAKNDYKALAELLTKEGLTAEIASVNRIDWLRNAAGVVDINYWKGTLNPQPTVNWYLSRSKLSNPYASALLHCAPASLLVIHSRKAQVSLHQKTSSANFSVMLPLESTVTHQHGNSTDRLHSSATDPP